MLPPQRDFAACVIIMRLCAKLLRIECPNYTLTTQDQAENHPQRRRHRSKSAGWDRDSQIVVAHTKKHTQNHMPYAYHLRAPKALETLQTRQASRFAYAR